MKSTLPNIYQMTLISPVLLKLIVQNICKADNLKTWGWQVSYITCDI